MSDNLKIRQPLDAKRINMNQAHEVAYWTRTISNCFLCFFASLTKYLVS